ncbi:MAG: OmpH family outer membrane protein [Bacteriovoracaceae bacterium]|nr:OmpH family outer membrane protein [Bacteriovoracaceae bacterium]
MKKIIMALLCLVLAAPSFAFVAGKVDMQKILITVKEGKKIRSTLKIDFDKKQAMIIKEEGSFKKATTAFEKQSLVMNAKAKAKKQRELQEMYMKLQQKKMGIQREMQAKEQKVLRPLINKIATIIRSVSKKEKIDLTYEVSSGSVVYAGNEIDLTNKVVKAYNKKYPVK